MLKEFNSPGTPENNLLRRYSSDEFFDLFVWLDADNRVVCFQLCYEKGRDEHCLTWETPSSYYHHRVDDGENRPGRYKSTPILVPDGAFDLAAVSRLFEAESEGMDGEIREFVSRKLTEFGKHPGSCPNGRGAHPIRLNSAQRGPLTDVKGAHRVGVN